MIVALAGGGLLGAFAMARRKRPAEEPFSFDREIRKEEEAGDLDRAWELRLAQAIAFGQAGEARRLRREGRPTERLRRMSDFHRRIDRED